MRSWAQEVDRTWLGDHDLVTRADNFVRTSIAKNRNKPGRTQQDIAACSVEVLVADVRTFGVAGRWFWVTSAICLLAELLFAAKKGGTFRDERAPEAREPAAAFRGLRILRNAVFHPAHSSVQGGAGEPHIAQFVLHLRGNGHGDLAEDLAKSWAFLAERRISSVSLGMLDSAARAHPDTKRFLS